MVVSAGVALVTVAAAVAGVAVVAELEAEQYESTRPFVHWQHQLPVDCHLNRHERPDSRKRQIRHHRQETLRY